MTPGGSPVRLPGWAAHIPPDTDPHTVDVLAEESLPRAWLARWTEDPEATVALVPGGSVLRADELEERSRMVAGRLAGAGLVAGDRLILSAEASLDVLVAYVAAHRLGLVVVPMNSSYLAGEVRHIVQNTSPAAAIVDDTQRGEVIRSVSARRMIVVASDVALADHPPPDLDLATRSTPALICHTSGTTGLPKGAVLTSGNLLASAEALRIAWQWTPEDRLALALPLFHLHGLGVGIHGTLVAGGSAILLGRFTPEAVATAARDQAASMFFGVPTMYHRLAEHAAAAALRSLRVCVSGSAPLPVSLHQRIEAVSGQQILERYGMTETVMNISNPYDGERRPGTVGFPLPGVDVRLAGDNPTEGEIQLRGPNVFAGYWNLPGATSEAFTSDGWFQSGDIGAVDDDGYFRIVGRSKELIISGGYNVYPREVEEALRTHPDVADVAVVGTPSDEWGETVTAFIVSGKTIPADEILAHVADRLAPYKRPRLIRFIDELPRNALGKVLRHELTG